jgi:histidyl-tRNA synthetase
MKGEQQIAAPRPELFLAALGEAAANEAFVLMNRLQRRGIHAEMDFGGKSLKAQMRRAGKLGARFVLILGDEELANRQAQLRDMDAGSQAPIALNGIDQALADKLAGGITA